MADVSEQLLFPDVKLREQEETEKAVASQRSIKRLADQELSDVGRETQI